MSIIACSIDECERPAKTRGWCGRHYGMWKRNGFPGLVKVKKVCTVEGCSNEHRAKGYCMMHYLRSKRSPNGVGGAEPRHVSDQTSCTFGDCKSNALSLHLCAMHYWRLKDFGPEGLDRISIHDPRHTVSYSGAHWRVANVRGKAADYSCDHCGGDAKQWAFDHLVESPLYCPDGRPYTTDISHYIPLCVSCHVTFDYAQSA